MNDFAQRVITLRKELSMTQEQLAQELGITAQAVSKWETGQSYPDITLLPKLAGVLHVRVDELLGVAAPQAADTEEDAAPDAPVSAAPALPWSDDPHTLHAVLFAGHTLIGAQEVTGCPEASRITFEYEGPALNIDSVFSVSCGNAGGSIQAGGNVSCDQVGGSVTADGSVNCDTVKGNVSAGGSVTCDSVDGSVTAGGNVTCDDVGGNVSAGGALHCDKVHGGASSASSASSSGTLSFRSGSGKKRGKGAAFRFGGSFDSRQFERSMNDFAQKMGRLGTEIGNQVTQQVNAAFDSGKDDEAAEDAFVDMTGDKD